MAVDAPTLIPEGPWWAEFIRHGGRMEKQEALDALANLGYPQQKVANHVHWKWLRLETVQDTVYYVFTELAWCHLAADYTAYLEANRTNPEAWRQDRGGC